MSCIHGNEPEDTCALCLKAQIMDLEASLHRTEDDLREIRWALGRVMRTLKQDVFHLDNWPQFEDLFLDGVCELLKELGKSTQRRASDS